ncbi:MAG: hypothetical protein WKF84_20655 [Pyrinomonadaceae bacterium]
MKLLIVSHTPHYWRSGELVGWGPTIREIDQLASLFKQVFTWLALHNEAPRKRSRLLLCARASGACDASWRPGIAKQVVSPTATPLLLI